MTSLAVVKGTDRTGNIKSALKLIEDGISKAISKKKSKRLFIKINTVDIKYPQSCTHPDALRAVLEFFDERFGREFDEIIVGDNTFLFTDNIPNPYLDAVSGFRNVRFSDLREFPKTYVKFRLLNGKSVSAPVSLLPSESFTISLTLPKTHDAVMFSGCSKNMFGCVLKKRHIVHALSPVDKLFVRRIVSANQIVHQNIADALSLVMPGVSVMDGWAGMEGDGPVIGAMVKLGWAMASDDCIALDRTAADLLGFGEVPYLKILEEKKLRTAKQDRIKIIKKGFRDFRQLRYNMKKHKNYQNQIRVDAWRIPWWEIDTEIIKFIIRRPHRWKDLVRRILLECFNHPRALDAHGLPPS